MNNFFKFNLLLIFFYVNLNSYPIFVNSIPKCGTHLLTKCISLITGKNERGYPTDKVVDKLPQLPNNQFFHCHIPYSNKIEELLKKQNYKVFFIYRDPRDQIVSHAYWIKQDSSKYLGLNKNPDIFSKDINKLIDIFINEINQFYTPFLPWLKLKNVCSIKFEDLIGGKKQKSTIKKICSYLNINHIKLDYTINYCANNLFGGTDTFRNGKTSEWKKHFSKEQKESFKKTGGQLLIDLGYEKDFNW